MLCWRNGMFSRFLPRACRLHGRERCFRLCLKRDKFTSMFFFAPQIYATRTLLEFDAIWGKNRDVRRIREWFQVSVSHQRCSLLNSEAPLSEVNDYPAGTRPKGNGSGAGCELGFPWCTEFVPTERDCQVVVILNILGGQIKPTWVVTGADCQEVYF